MAIKQNLVIKDKNLDEKYLITGQSGIYKEEDYKSNDEVLLTKKVGRFILIDLWSLGVFGSENCNQKWSDIKEVNITTEKDIDEYVKKAIKYINDGLFDTIKEHIIDEIEADEGENIIIGENNDG